MFRRPTVLIVSGTRIDGEINASIKSPPHVGQAQLTDFNFKHPLLQEYVDADEEPSQDTDYSDPFGTKPGIEIWELFHDMASSAELKGVGEFRVAAASVIGALSDFD